MSESRPQRAPRRSRLGRFVDEHLLYTGTPPEAEARFQDHVRQIMRIWFRVLAWALILPALLLWPTDYVQFPDRPDGVSAFRVWRVGLLLVALGGLFGFRFLPWIRRHPRAAISAGMMVAAGLGGYAMSRLGGLDEPWFYTAYALPALPALLLWPLPQRLMVTALVTLAWVATYFVAAPRHIDYGYLLNPSLFLSFLVVMSTAFGHVVYHLFRLFHFERERLAERSRQLESMDRLKSEFFANLSHELRTPLTLILGSFRALAKRCSLEEDRRAAEAGIRNGARLLLLINDLLDLARAESDPSGPRRRRVDVAALTRQVVANFDSGSDDGSLTTWGVDDPVPAEVDPTQIKKVLYNLVSNAIKFTDPARRRIRVVVGTTDDQLALDVSDNGVGIPADQIDRVFDRFTQVDAGAGRRFEGTGIGLALVDEIVRAHGGGITVESVVGEGATFRVRLPRGAWDGPIEAVERDDMVDELHQLGRRRSGLPAPGSGAAAPAGPAPSPATGAVPRATVLVAEDNADLREYIVDLLQGRYRVLAARDGREALEIARRERPDLVLTDVMMPEVTGIGVLHELRQVPWLSATPVVFLTARADAQARVEALEGGADDYVSKPFDEDELFARIDNLLRSRAQEREVLRLNGALREANERLEARVEEQMAELIRSGQLKRFLPPDIAERILRGEIDPDHHLERSTATILFADIVGYTEISARLEVPDLARVLDGWVREMTAVVVANEGFVDKFIGDGVMAVFTADAGSDLPARVSAAARAAVAMRERLDALNARWRGEGIDVDIRLRIGLHTGPVVLGVFGGEQRQTFTVVGAAVNVASRLQHEAQPGEILISDVTHFHLADHFRAEPRGELRLKGIETPVTTWRLLGP